MTLRSNLSPGITAVWKAKSNTFRHTFNGLLTGLCYLGRYSDTTDSGNKKLNPKFRGPYVIHKVLPHARYVERDVEGCQLTQLPFDGVLEANKLRRWTESSD